MRTRSILALFPGALGDYLCVRPTLLRLRQRAGGELTVVTRDAYFPLLAADALAALSIERREVADLFAATPLRAETARLLGGRDHIHSWTGHRDANFTTRLATLARQSAHVHPFRALRRGQHASNYYARCAGVMPLRQPLPIPAAARAWAVGTLAAPRHLLVVHAGSGGRRKNWLGMEEIARRWRCEQGDVAQIVGPGESGLPVLESAFVLREQPLDRVAAALQAATFYIGNDSGITHLAAAVGARGIALFGPTRARAWAPRGGGVRVLSTRRTCRACGDLFCTHRLPVETVWQRLVAETAALNRET
jgi:ADP-heptose:LPS heptosyltransferase